MTSYLSNYLNNYAPNSQSQSSDAALSLANNVAASQAAASNTTASSGDIPVDFVPDDQFNANKAQHFATTNDLLLYQYAPGTKTGDAKVLEETVRNNNLTNQYEMADLAEKVREADLDNQYKNATLAETVRNNDLENSYRNQSLQTSLAAAAGKAALNNAKSVSAEIKDNFIAAIRAGGLKHANYNYKGAFDKMNAHGGFDNVTPADMAAILKEVTTLSNPKSKSDDWRPLKKNQ